MNERIRTAWESATGFDPQAGRKLSEIDRKMANIREALANGLDDIAWANEQLRALKEQRAELEQAVTLVGDPPQIDAQQAQVYRQKLEETLAKGTPASRRAMLRECVAEVRLFPDTLEVEAAYLLPVAAIKNGSRILRSQSR